MFGAEVSSLGTLEEFLPFTDILPTATLAWVTYLGTWHLAGWFLRGRDTIGVWAPLGYLGNFSQLSPTFGGSLLHAQMGTVYRWLPWQF